MPDKRPSFSQALSGGSNESHRTETTETSRFTVWVDRAQSSGPLLERFLSERTNKIVLGLSPTSATVNQARLKPLLDWVLAKADGITVVDGAWFHRWDRVAFDQLPIESATLRSIETMSRLHRRIRRLVGPDSAHRSQFMQWPACAHVPGLLSATRMIDEAEAQSSAFREALQQVVNEYLDHLQPAQCSALTAESKMALLNYVREEVATFIYLIQHVSPVEVYPGADLAIMRRLASGEFANVIAVDLSQRTHVSVQLIPTPVGTLRKGRPEDLSEIERLIRSWPSHFVAEALPFVRADFNAHSTTVCDDGAGRVLGFMIWKTDGAEMELLWMAVDPDFARRGICRSVVQAVLCERDSEERVFLRTATLDSVIPNSGFSGAAYASTYRFFEFLGFRLGERHEGHWGPSNHMIEIERDYGC